MNELKTTVCPKCGATVYEGQYTCHNCDTVIPAYKEIHKKPKKTKE